MVEATDCLFIASVVLRLSPLAENWEFKITIFHITTHETSTCPVKKAKSKYYQIELHAAYVRDVKFIWANGRQISNAYKQCISFINYVLHSVIRGRTMSIITIRVPRTVKEKLKKYNVNVSQTVRKVLDERLEELERKDLEEKLEKVKEHIGDKLNPELLAKLVREDRETH